MKASILDLRYKTKEVLQALDRNEEVSILYRGKLKGRIFPVRLNEKGTAKKKVKDHPFFASSEAKDSVTDVMERLRGGRY